MLMLFSNPCSALNSKADPPQNLSEQLSNLATANNFTIRGIEKTKSFDARQIRGDVESRIDQLLSNFNYLLIRTEQGQPDQLIILNRKPTGPKPIILSTRKQGSQHIVRASIRGLSNSWRTVDLLVDTGADRVVLPSSMMDSLGYIDEALETAKLQTVNGILEAKTGHLEAIELGNEIIDDIAVAFVKDELLGDIMLLGMNVLSRYRVTVHQSLNQITLIRER